jgi:uncharacterized phiE125 gp8 family phage protein
MTDFLTVPWSQPAVVQTRLVTPPTVEPLTVEELKLRASMLWPVTDPPDPRDAMMSDFIRAARAKVEQDTGLSLLTTVIEVTFGTWCGQTPLPMGCLPVQDIEDVTAATAHLHIRMSVVPGTNRVTVHSVAAPTAGTVLLVTAGWPDVATLKIEAPLLHQAVALLATHYATLGRDLAITGAVAALNVVPEGYEALIAPHRLTWVA